MDSLVANYASSDDDDDQQSRCKNTNSARTLSSKSFLGSLPPPKSSSSLHSTSVPLPKPSFSIFSSLPPPKTTLSSSSLSSSLIFSSLPPPETEHQQQPVVPKPASAKRIVQFRPPIDPSVLKHLDDDDDDEGKKERKPVGDFSSKSLSAIMPAPKNSLCLAPVTSSSSLRRSIVEADVSVSKTEVVSAPLDVNSDYENYGSYYGNWAGGTEGEGQLGVDNGGGDGSTGWVASNGGYYENYGSCDGNWDYRTTAVGSEALIPPPDMGRIAGKRGRNDAPLDILEVKQDDLVKDRPREDQVKLTGIAFGPAYQPVSSQKGKPSKLHKRKHQIGSLFFDMKQKEMELSERRARGMLTKRETQGKYGW